MQVKTVVKLSMQELADAIRFYVDKIEGFWIDELGIEVDGVDIISSIKSSAETFTEENGWMDIPEDWDKPEVILINGIEVPKPCDEQLDKGQQYFYPCIEASNLCTGVKWNDDIYDERLLKRGLVHLTKEAAIKHAEALLSFTQVNVVFRDLSTYYNRDTAYLDFSQSGHPFDIIRYQLC